MSFDKQTIKLKLANCAEQLTDHLIKLYLFPNTDYVTHWRKEVWNFLNKVPRFSYNNKRPSSKFIYDIISGYVDDAENLMYTTMSEYDAHVPQRFDPDELEAMLSDYFEWLSNELSENGSTTSSKVYDKLKELGF